MKLEDVVAILALAHLAVLPILYALYGGAEPVAVVRVSADVDGFNVTLTLLRTNASGVFITYGPEHSFYSPPCMVCQRATERHTIVGECNGTRSDLVKIQRGQTVTCRFPARLVANMRYAYKVGIMIGRGFATVAEGTVVPKN